MPTDGAAANMAGGRELVLPPNGDSHGRDRLVGGGYIRCPPLEHHHAVNCE